MTHAANNCSHTSVCAELGISVGTNRNQTTLTRHASVNKYAFYAPGVLSVDSSKDLVLTAPSNNDKLGDFRSYNHSAATPAAATNFTHNWGPAGSTTNVTMVSLPGEMNILYADSGATYITYRGYLSTTARTNETPLHGSADTDAASFSGVTPPTGHTRTQTQRIQGTHVGTFTVATAGLSTPNDFLYVDTFFSNSGGTRLVNMGTVAGGYTTVTMHQLQTPWVDSVGTCISRPGYTGSHTEINNTASSCTGADVPLTQGTTAYSFYVRAVGISAGLYNIAPSNCTVRIRHYNGSGGIRQTITHTSQNLDTGSKNGKQYSGNVSNSFDYDDYIKCDITVVSTWGTARIC